MNGAASVDWACGASPSAGAELTAALWCTTLSPDWRGAPVPGSSSRCPRRSTRKSLTATPARPPLSFPSGSGACHLSVWPLWRSPRAPGIRARSAGTQIEELTSAEECCNWRRTHLEPSFSLDTFASFLPDAIKDYLLPPLPEGLMRISIFFRALD